MIEHPILVVEDDPIQRRQIARVLAAEGYEVLLASSGNEAVRLLAEWQIAMVLTDRKMPGMNGTELLGYVKKNYPAINVVMVTAYPEEMDEHQPDALLTKPFRGHQLIELIHSVSGKASL